MDEPDTDSAREMFEEAYRLYLHAVKQAWAEIDVDAVAQDMTDGRRGLNGCGEAAAFNCLGSAGTLGSAGSLGGTFGSFGTIATFGCHVVEEGTGQTDDMDAAQSYRAEPT
jgi:hypothetical protein